jgi:hypothetical protein
LLITCWDEILNTLLHIVTESEADSDHESQDADRFIAQSTLGIIEGCIADDQHPKDNENNIQDNNVDEQRTPLSTGLGKQQFVGLTLTGFKKQIWKVDVRVGSPYGKTCIVIWSS